MIDVGAPHPLSPAQQRAYNGPGEQVRATARADAVVEEAPRPPRRLGHFVLGTPHIGEATAFFIDGLGFKISDQILNGVATFLRIESDHHNLLIQPASTSYLNHYAFEVDDVDAIGKAGTAVVAERADASVVGVGRHNLGSNIFWYLTDPAGTYFEFYSDMDQIVDDELWEREHLRRDWEGSDGPAGFSVWGPDRTPARVLQPASISTRSVPPAKHSAGTEALVDLGISGRRAILLASSRGLGRACAESIAREGVDVVVNGRTADDVESAVAEIGDRYAVRVQGVVGDSSTTEIHDALLEACPEPDIVLLNGEGPSPMPFDRIDEPALEASLRQSLIGPLMFVQRVVPGMRERGFGRIVAVSSAMVKSPNPMMSLSHGPRLGLTGVLKGLSKDLVAHNVTVNQLLPERFDTGRQQQMAELVMRFKGITYDEARAEQVASIKAGRLGRPDEFGDAFAFLCAAQSGYLSGQNLQLDGGSYEGVF